MMNYSFYTKESGEKIIFEEDDPNDTDNLDGTIDTRQSTETMNSTIYLNHNIVSYHVRCRDFRLTGQ